MTLISGHPFRGPSDPRSPKPADSVGPRGFSPILSERDCISGIDFGIWTLSEGDTIQQTEKRESAWLLLDGTAELIWEGGQALVNRNSIFHESPSVLHLGPRSSFEIRAVSHRVEWAVMRVENATPFEAKLFLPEDSESEERGKGLVHGACQRTVRQVFDRKNRPDSHLVLGEVINSPGKWSSYPPHHHLQPEFYHYRFTLPQGYGHAELGDDILKIRHGDTVEIPGGLDHAQVSAPGYGMYYLWVVRHLPKQPYTGFEFTREHEWVLDPTHPNLESIENRGEK